MEQISRGVGRSERPALAASSADDVVAQRNALVADEHRRAGDELLDFVLALAAEGAVEQFFLAAF